MQLICLFVTECGILLFERFVWQQVSEYVCLVDSSEMFFLYTVISELAASVSSPNKAVSTDKSVKDDSKFNGRLRSQIKVQNMTDKKKVWQQAYINSVQYMYMYRYCVSFTLCICCS